MEKLSSEIHKRIVRGIVSYKHKYFISSDSDYFYAI